MPVFSIIVPLFNRVNLIDETINSVINQTFHSWELLIVDDNSTDGSYDKAKSWQKNFQNVYVFKNLSKKGAPCCRNIGIQKSIGNYLIFLDSDDLLASDALEKRMKAIAKNKELDMLISPCIIFTKHKHDKNILWNINESSNCDLDRFLKFDVPWQTTSISWKATSLKRLGNWDENLLSFQDWELGIRAIINNLSYQKTTYPDCYWREPSANVSSIGKNSNSISHINSHKYLIAKVTQELKIRGLLSFQRKKYLVYFNFWLFEKQKSISKRTALISIYSSFKKLKIPFFLFFILIVLAFLDCWEKFTSFKMRIINILKIHELFYLSDNTFRNVQCQRNSFSISKVK